jgi:hypothetical protein
MGGPSVGHSQIRIQIAYVKGLGVRFRIAAKEVKGMGVHTPAERSSPANTPDGELGEGGACDLSSPLG